MEQEEKKFEEVKPDFWIRKTWNNKYIQVYPIKKDPNKPFGKGNGVNWKNAIIGDKKMYVFWGIMILLLFAYKHDISEYKRFYNTYINNTQNTLNLYYKNITVDCKPEYEKQGLCIRFNDNITNFSLIESKGILN